jgi:hypothetical protein
MKWVKFFRTTATRPDRKPITALRINKNCRCERYFVLHSKNLSNNDFLFLPGMVGYVISL